MSSKPNRSTTKRRARPETLGAAILAAALLTATARAATHDTARTREAAHPKLVLSAYEDRAAGANLLAGRYGAVIEELGSHGMRFASDEVGASTNLCVAYIMTGSWSTAHSACDEALELAKHDSLDPDLPSRRTHAEQIALAYSNRAVLDWLEHRQASAAADLSKAKALAPGSPFLSENLAALASRSGAGVLAAAGD